MDGRNTEAVSPRCRARTNRPTACAKNSAVPTLVAYTPTASRGMSTPSDTIRTATIHRSSEVANAAIFFDAAGSSDSTTTGRRVERGPPGLGDLVLGHRGAQGGGDLVPGPGAPVHLAGVGQEDHRAHYAV